MNERSALQSLASWVGAALLVLAILGFVPGVTDDFALLRFGGHRSAAQLFGVFDVSILLNLVHALLGVAGLWLARRRASARVYLLGGGTVLVALWIFGLAVGRGDHANFLPVDSADDWLHFGFGLLMLGGALLLGRGYVPHQNEAARAT
jgi:hypothetical protein